MSRWCATSSKRYDVRIARYTTRSFMRAKLGDALGRGNLAPHVLESEPDHKASLRAG